MLEHIGGRVVLAVAQKPFEPLTSGSGILHQFCTLLPLLDEEGVPANPDEFPAKGDVWWMLRPGSRGLAEPGRLLIGILEESLYSGDPTKAHYQVVVDSVEALRARDYVEILDVATESIGEPRQLVARKTQIDLDHVPQDEVFVRWHGRLYGPLRTRSEPVSTQDGQWRVRFLPVQADNTVLEMSDEVLRHLPPGAEHRLAVRVSLDSRAPVESAWLHTCQYHLISAREFQTAIPHDAKRVVFQTDDLIIQRVAKRFLSRAQRREFLSLMTELQEKIAASGEELRREEVEPLTQLAELVRSEDAYSQRLAAAVLEMGILDARISDAIERKTKEHIAENAARLQTEINREIGTLRGECEEWEKKIESLKNAFDVLKRKQTRELDVELNALREACSRECAEERQRLDKQIQELSRQRHVLSENLTKVAHDLGVNRDEVVNQFLAISPLLQQFGLLPGAKQASEPSSTGSTPPPPLACPEFLLPAFITRPMLQESPQVQETAFFERLCRHVQDAGFQYRDIDLLSFHVSVKCGDLTILGGLPGTGKSSLPRLYAEVLVGDDYDMCRQRYLQINVSPSWLDMRDLLGHINALDRCFQPAESHLYEQILWAQEEEAQRGQESGMYVICLDEMNLAHVEHYFSGFLQVLESTESVRTLRCFAPDAVSPASTFAKWPAVNLPRTLRFVGTVNFDETTRQLSQRLLDRANLIRLPSDSLPLQLKEALPVKPQGSPITLRTFRDWTSTTAQFDPSLGELIDALRDHLTVLGCPMNPRRFSAIRKFIASVPPQLGSPEQALDLQIAQRILPQMRGLFRPGAREAMDGIRKTLENHRFTFPESLRVLEDVRNSEYPSALFDEGTSA